MTHNDADTVVNAILTMRESAQFLEMVAQRFRTMRLITASAAADLCDAHAEQLKGAIDALGNIRLMEQASNDWGV